MATERKWTVKLRSGTKHEVEGEYLSVFYKDTDIPTYAISRNVSGTKRASHVFPADVVASITETVED